MTHSEMLNDKRGAIHTSVCEGKMVPAGGVTIYDEYLSQYRCSECGTLIRVGMTRTAMEVQEFTNC